MAVAVPEPRREPPGGSEEIFFPDVKTTLNLFAIHSRKVGGDWSYPLHEHPQYEINYLLAGRQAMTVNGVTYEQEAGELLLLKPGDVHTSRSADGRPFEYFCLHFDLDDRLFLSVLGRMEQVLFPADSRATQRIAPVLERLLDSRPGAERSSVAGRMRLQSAVFELFAQLWDALSEESLQLPARAYGKVDLAHEIAGRLRTVAAQTFRSESGEDEPGGIAAIAAQLGLSASHCSRVFREVYGCSPRAYWSDLVLHEARQLLADPRYSIQAVAAILGYRDIAHFSRQFKRWTGLSPSEYRARRLRGEEG